VPRTAVETRSVHANEHVAVTDLGSHELCQAQDLGRAVRVLDHRLHRARLCLVRVAIHGVGLSVNLHDGSLRAGGLDAPY
jgi:hypothetical protein